MRRYCIDYTSVHDASVCDAIMSDAYEITISGRTMGMDGYGDAVAAAFRRYPTLVLTVHDMILSGDRLAMHFSEHGAAADDPDHVAVWPGISLYRWDGAQLLSCRVEQDFLGRDEQTASGHTAALDPGHPDPWATTRNAPTDDITEAALRTWLDRLASDPATTLAAPEVRLLETGDGREPLLSDGQIMIDDMFSAGDRAAAAVTIRGAYAGGLPGVDAALLGTDVELPATLLARVTDGAVSEIRLVRDRWGLIRRLRRSARD
ncbi:MAG: nuclear transport factor 2 family protein [Chloroflexota bacterium]